MPAIVATSQLPKCPVSTSTPLPIACAATKASMFSTRTSAALRAADSQRKRRNSAGEPPQVRIVRLRERDDLRLAQRRHRRRGAGSRGRRRGAAAGSGTGSVRPAARSTVARSASATADALTRSWVNDSAIDAMRWRPSTSAARGPQIDARRAIVVARDGKVRRLNGAERRLAREELDAGFLGRKAGGEACRAPGTLAAVGELLRAKRACAGRRPASRRAAARCARSRRCRSRSGRPARGHPPSDGARRATGRGRRARRRCPRIRGRG